MTAALWIGIDVAKRKLDCALGAKGERIVLANELAALEALATRLKGLDPAGIVLEASGGYEKLALAVLARQQLPLVLVNPRRTRAFAQAQGQLAKSDPIDAHTLALFGERMLPEIRPLPGQALSELRDLFTRREQLVDMLATEKTRLHQARPASVKRSIQALIAVIERQIDRAERELLEAIQAHPLWSENDSLLRSAPGIGTISALGLVLKLPELGTLSRQQIGVIAGVAPFDQSSGQRDGPRHIRGGRAAVRALLYMATLTAIRFNPLIKAFYERLIARNKAHKVAMVACMHKLLTILNAMLKHRQAWNPKFT